MIGFALRGLGVFCVLALTSGLLFTQNPPPRSENLNFSHSFHLLQVKATCVDCHAGAVISTSAGDNNLPVEETCLNCHDGTKARNECTLCHSRPQTARAFEAPQRTIYFDHQKHLGLGNLAPLLASAIDSGTYLGESTSRIRPLLDTQNSCAACHRGLKETDFATSIHLPQMADCLVCHAEIDPPFSCRLCHTPAAQILPASHTPDYIERHSRTDAALDKPSCRICHGTNFRCMGCH